MTHTFPTWSAANAFMVSQTLRGVYATQPILIDGVWQVRS